MTVTSYAYFRQLQVDDVERYSRQIPIIGDEGQERLRNSAVLIVGVGGLGSIAALYLALAGIGRLILIDDGIVELSNLNRQVLYGPSDIGRPKALVAKEKLEALNPDVKVEAYNARLDENLGRALIERANVVIDALDNWPSRHLLNRLCVSLKRPLIHAGVYGLYGQITTIIPGKGPCLACIFPRPIDVKGPMPIIGPASGVLGLLQACEAIKLITGIGKPLVGRLLIIDLSNMEFSQVEIRRNSSCPVCGGI